MTKKEKFFSTRTTGVGTTTINYAGYGYGKHFAGMTNVYGYAPDGTTFDYIVSYHRSKVLLRMLESGEWWNLNEDVRMNYATNGYTTRVGVKRADAARCKKLADSHRVIDESGKEAHDARVRRRN